MITNYAELQGAVADWLHRAELTSQIQNFIFLAERQLNTRLRVMDQERRAIVNTVADQQYIPQPVGMRELRNLQYNGEQNFILEQMSLEQMDRLNIRSVGRPCYYAIYGDCIQLAPVPSGIFELECVYFAEVPNLSDANQTNYFVTEVPDLILYQSLVQAEPFIMNDERLPMWKALTEELIQTVNNEARDRRFSGNVLAASPDTSYVV